MRNPILVGPRVYLRPFEVDDAPLLAEAETRETDTFMERGREINSPIAFEHRFKTVYEEVSSDEIPFAVCLKENDVCIGMVSLDSVDWINRVAETGSWFHEPDYRNKGYGTEAKHLLLEYAFDRLHLEMLISCVFEPNTRSAAALAKQGYKPAGTIKWDELKDGVFRGVRWFDISRDEWLEAWARWQAEQDQRQSTS